MPTVENAISQAIADGRYLKLAGGTMSGDINMGGQDITNMASLALAEQSPVPASASANTLLLYSEAVKGFSFLSSLDDTGMRRKFQRDSVFVGKNTTGSSIPAFRAVYAIGSENDVPLIAKARANSVNTMPAIGVTIEAIANGAYGRIMQIGLVENANTSAFTAGDILYVSSTTAGILVATAPLWPNIRQEIGTILAVDASVGSVQVVARSMFNEGILDHGGLLGLADNDHTQYLLLAGGTMVGNIVMSGAETVDGRDLSADGAQLDELYTTIGLSALTSAEVDQLENIGAVTISSTQWGYLGALDQGLTTTSNVEFAQVTITGTGKVIFNAATEYWSSASAGYLDGYAATGVNARAPLFNLISGGAATIKASTGGGAGDDAVLELVRSGADWTITADVNGALVFAYPSTEACHITSAGHLIMAGTRQVQFNDSGTYIYSAANSYLDVVADGAFRVTAPLMEVIAGSSANPHSFARLVVEDDTHAMINILTPNNSLGYLGFGDPEDAFVAGISYNHSTNVLGVQSGDTVIVSATSTAWQYQTTVKAEFRDTGLHISSPSDGVMALVTDGTITLGAAATNQTVFSSVGLQTMIGSARVKRSLDFSGAQLERGATAPTAVPVGDYTTWEYDIGDDSILDAFEVPHDWASGTDLSIEVHWQINEAYATANGEVQWRVEWSATPDDASESIAAPTHSGTIDSGDVNIPATARHLTKTTIGTIAGASIAAGDEIGLTLSRIALVGGTDPTADPGAIHVHVAYTADKLGEAT
ncbi:MAG: hypothetical protein ACYTFI_00775 [Planctomycetota bacterium]|jgi:hypothetical protein